MDQACVSCSVMFSPYVDIPEPGAMYVSYDMVMINIVCKLVIMLLY